MARLDVTESVEARRPREEVWAYVVDGFFENHRHWDPAITELVQLTEGPMVEGTRGRETRSFGGKQSADFEVTELRRPSVFAFLNTSGPFHLERRFVFDAEASATRVTFRFVMAPKGPMHLVFPLVRRTVARQVRANIARIPGLVEVVTPSAPERE